MQQGITATGGVRGTYTALPHQGASGPAARGGASPAQVRGASGVGAVAVAIVHPAGKPATLAPSAFAMQVTKSEFGQGGGNGGGRSPFRHGKGKKAHARVTKSAFKRDAT